MSRSQLVKSVIQISLVLTIGVSLITYGGLRRHAGSAHERFLYPPSDIKTLTLGYNDVMADVLWLRVLQDFDFCDQVDIESNQPKQSRLKCKKGWVYQMVNVITELAPRFKIAHTAGANMLSVVVNDPEGADAIYEKAVPRFPTDWQIPYRAGYNKMIEMHQPQQAAELLAEAGKRGAPGWVYSLAGRLLTKEGQLELASSVLGNALKQGYTREYEARVREKYEEIQARLKKEQ